MKKRIFSILLMLCMVLTFMPTAAMAATPTGTPLTQSNVTSDGTLSLSGNTSYYLNGDVTISKTISISGTVTLDLNGHVLKYENAATKGSVIKVEASGNLTLEDSNTDNLSHKFKVQENGLWVLDETEGTETVTGGVITGGTGTEFYNSVYGGGIYVGHEYAGEAHICGTLKMNGGNIVGCTAEYGGGIGYLFSNFTIINGCIKGCTAEDGGGVFVKEGNFTMKGGTIEYCKATIQAGDGEGGGVCVTTNMSVNDCVFNMFGGEISNCVSDCGGGVYVNWGACVFNMTDGTIKDCISDFDSNLSGGVYIKGDNYYDNEMNAVGGVIEDNVYINNDGKITCSQNTKGTTFNGEVTNYGTISGGTFYGGITGTGTISTTKYEVSFDLNDDSSTAPVTQVFVNTNSAKAVDPNVKPSKDGYTFDAWYNGENKWNFSTAVTSDITLTAKFTPVNYSITYNSDGDTANNPTSYTIESADITLTNPTKAGYTFTGWSGTDLAGDDNKIVTIPKGSTGNRNYTAHWQKNSSSHSSYVQKPTISFGGADVTTETLADGSTVYTTAEGKLVLSKDGTTASITAADDYEVAKVSVNGTEKGTITTLTGLRTGDKIVVTFKQTAEAQTKAELAQIKSMVEKMSLTARSTKTAKKNIKVTLKTDNETTAAIKEIKSLGYTVKYKYYRSTKKASKYAAKVTKTGKTYTNTNGKNNTRYYYKARVQVYDTDGKMIAQTALRQCKYATRIFG